MRLAFPAAAGVLLVSVLAACRTSGAPGNGNTPGRAPARPLPPEVQEGAARSTSAASPGAARLPAAPPTAEACRACNGVWGNHGLLQQERCLCRARDSGKRCRDGAECEGDCVTDGKETETTSPGPPPMGRFVGRCSELVTTFGCHMFLLDGAAKRGPVPLDEPPPMICVD